MPYTWELVCPIFLLVSLPLCFILFFLFFLFIVMIVSLFYRRCRKSKLRKIHGLFMSRCQINCKCIARQFRFSKRFLDQESDYTGPVTVNLCLPYTVGAFTILSMVTIGTFIYQWHTINTNDCHWYFILVTNSAYKPVKLELPTRAFHKTIWWPQVLKEEFEDTKGVIRIRK